MSSVDLDIARAVSLQPIAALARERLGLAPELLIPYGHYKAKLAPAALAALETRPEGQLILVTAISPTPAGEGKTTTTIGLGDALTRLGRRAMVCLRQPSLGPCLGMKGGATGGGRAQVAPMDEINLHFTGDFHAVASAHNLLAAMLDNHVHQGNALGIDLRRVVWRRVVDMNDRALRQITVGLGGTANGFPREDGFDIVVASEVMAILCLAQDFADLKARLARIVVAYTADKRPLTAADLRAEGAMAALLKDALLPNLVQTLEGTPALVHGGPFANIAHGCNSALATRSALKLADYVLTEAGFGADLGAEKFIDIKCRKTGLQPACAVLVATVRALRWHGGDDAVDAHGANLASLERGLANLRRHAENLRLHLGLPVVVAINRFAGDSEAELALIERACEHDSMPCVRASHWADGGAGAQALAHEVLRLCAGAQARPPSVYGDAEPLVDKIRAVARKIYRAADVSFTPQALAQLHEWQSAGHGELPVCIAKTPYSFSADAKLRGAAEGHVLPVRELRLAAGAGFVVAICGDIMTMPGLPRHPAAERLDLDAQGFIVGLG